MIMHTASDYSDIICFWGTGAYEALNDGEILLIRYHIQILSNAEVSRTLSGVRLEAAMRT